MLGHGYQWSRGEKLKDSAAWLYDLKANAWTNMRPPPYKEPEKGSRRNVGGLNSGATYDPNHEVVLSFGGQDSAGGKNTLAAYDAYSNTLTYLAAENPPSARDGMGLAYDAPRDKLVMFGSQYLADERTWLYDLRTNRWEGLQLDPHPPANKVTTDYYTMPRLAYDPLHKIMLCLAWLGEKQGHETWSLDLGKREWTKLNPAAEAAGSKSRSRNLDFDAARNLFILETSSAETNHPEIWTYRYQPAGATDAAESSAPPLPPRNLTVTTDPDGNAKLAWEKTPWVGVNTNPIKVYAVYRSRATDGAEPWKADFTKIAETVEPHFEDHGLQTGQVYFYSVKTVGFTGLESRPSFHARTQPRVLLQPVVSVRAADQIEIAWNRHPAADLAGYNLYRGVATVRTVKKGTQQPWRDNDPEYDEPQVVKVADITRLQKLNVELLTEEKYLDRVDLTKPLPESGEYKYAVYAYLVCAVNKLGTESGPSPYALTIPAEPTNVLCREQGDTAELKWDAGLKGIAGYHVYKLKSTFEIVRVTDRPLTEPTFRHKAGKDSTRYWVVAVDSLGQEGQPSSPAWFNHSYKGFYPGEWHQ